MKLLKFELNKILTQKSVYIVFIILFSLNLIKDQDFQHGPMNNIDFVSQLITAGMILVALSTIFTREYSSGVEHYILSSNKGRKTIGWTKIGASLIFTAVVVFTWEILIVAINLFWFGNTGWGDPIQSLLTFSNSQYELSLLEYHLAQIGIHLLGAFCLALLIVLLSSISKSSIVVFFTAALILLGPILLDEINAPWISEVLKFSIFHVMSVETLFFELRSVQILGFSVSYPILASLLMIVLSLLFIKLILLIVKNKEVTG